ncbi:MAG: N-acyl-D-glutamate deacylase [Clostridia bacterium]|jgi:N-acyl-D-amino-acid deacylase|nr:N-acyl-D-glutamate deacylase [Clostridia bacterium]
MSLLLKNGNVNCGIGEKSFIGDILIQDGKIHQVGKIDGSAADKVIDVTGKEVTPGFIDAHRHLDFNVFNNKEFGKIELAQGITAAIGGTCGLAPYPSCDNSRTSLYNFIEPCLGKAPENFKADSFISYRNQVQEIVQPLHLGFMVATGAVKTCVKGYESKSYTQKEMEAAQRLLVEGIENGAKAISCGIMYTPECYSTKQEFIDLLMPAAKYNVPLVSHIRGEGNSLITSVEEIISIGEACGIPVNISHLKAVGKKNWEKQIFKAIEKIEAARNRGLRVTADFYPYEGGSTTLLSLIPPSCAEEDVNQLIEKLSTKTGVEKLKTEIYKEHSDWDNMVLDIGWERIVISSVHTEESKRYQGLSVQYICQMENIAEPVEFIADLLVRENGKISIIVMSMCLEDIYTIAKLPYTTLISDSLYGSLEHPHPRLYGSFPKFLKEYAIEQKIVSFETAINKMTGMVADLYNIKDRGKLINGNWADIVIFDKNKISANASFTAPAQLSQGIEYAFSDGVCIWNNQKTVTKQYKANFI